MKLVNDKRKLWIIDGGTGTWIEQKKGNTENMEDAWSALCALTDAKILGEVHRDYIDAGAEIIIANTYATHRHVLKPVGKEHLCAEAIKKSVEIARVETEPTNAILAGSFSTHPPLAVKQAGGTVQGSWPGDDELTKSGYESTVELLKNNVDCIFIEMMKELDHAIPALRGVRKAWLESDKKVPVFLGTSARIHRDTGEIVFLDDGTSSIPYDETTVTLLLDALRDVDVVGINVMHTNFNACKPAIQSLRKFWKGIIGVYPDHGYWQIPQWVHKPVDDRMAIDFAMDWMELGVNMIGGCCGTTPELIKCFHDNRAELQNELNKYYDNIEVKTKISPEKSANMINGENGSERAKGEYGDCITRPKLRLRKLSRNFAE